MLILASRSKARKNILKNLRIRFKVIVPRVKEHKGLAASPKAIVGANALLKARDVASRLKSGVVIGCDTLVEQDGKIFGKPKDLKEARAMLKRLSRAPHRLFTGIAIVDVRRKKEAFGVEETRIVMERLSDAEISDYFQKVSPLEMAGGFDIQGLGSLFIKRIEGCYFNVVGLPVSRMYTLLKKLGVSLLVFFCCFYFFGCATEYNVVTNKEDKMMYSTDQEVAMGDSFSRQVEKDYRVVNDRELNERLQRVGKKLVAVCDRKELFYRFRVIEDKKDPDMVNAASLPGGYVYVFKNLFKVADTDDELASVLGHEIGHIVARHSIKQAQAIWGYNILSVLAAGTGNPDVAFGTQAGYLQILSGYSQEDELLADKLGARYAKRAGYDPKAMITFLQKLWKYHKKEELRPFSYFRTHPYTGARVKAAREELGDKMTFDDFLNTY